MIKIGISGALAEQIAAGGGDPESVRGAMFDQNRKALAYLQNLAMAETLNTEEVERIIGELGDTLLFCVVAMHTLANPSETEAKA